MVTFLGKVIIMLGKVITFITSVTIVRGTQSPNNVTFQTMAKKIS